MIRLQAKLVDNRIFSLLLLVAFAITIIPPLSLKLFLRYFSGELA